MSTSVFPTNGWSGGGGYRNGAPQNTRQQYAAANVPPTLEQDRMSAVIAAIHHEQQRQRDAEERIEREIAAKVSPPYVQAAPVVTLSHPCSTPQVPNTTHAAAQQCTCGGQVPSTHVSKKTLHVFYGVCTGIVGTMILALVVYASVRLGVRVGLRRASLESHKSK